MSGLRIGLLGPLEIRIGDETVDVGGPRQRAVLAVLALQPNRIVSTEQLVDSIWGEDPPASAKSTLQAYISRLRRALSDAGDELIRRDTSGYTLAVDADGLDIEQFSGLVSDGRRATLTGVPDVAAQRFQQALELWRGTPLADLGEYDFARSELARLEGERLIATGEWIEAELAAGGHERMVGELEGLVAGHPFHEAFWSQLMVALYRSGRQADALATYQSAREKLIDELGIEPGPALVATEAAILAQDSSLDLTTAPPDVEVESRSGGPADYRRNALVGRDPELLSLSERLDQVPTHGGGLVVVAGPAGIGKTALLAEFAEHARANGTRVYWGRAWEDEGAPAFWTWIEVLRAWAADVGHDEVRSLAGRRTEHLARLLPELGLADDPGREPQQAHFALYEVVASVLADSAEVEPIVIVLDDLQWADVSSIQLLTFLARRLATSQVLVVASRRDPAPTSDAVAAALRELDAAPHAARFSLVPLDQGEIAALVAQAASTSLPESILDEIASRSGGLPFYVVELARAAGHLDDGLAVPPTLREIIVQRLGRLDADARELLSMAAVAGDEFSLAVVGHAVTQQGAELLRSLEEAIAAGVVQAVSGRSERYRFEHALVREALYAALGPADLVERHGRLADALAVMTRPGSEEHVAERAHHALEAATIVPDPAAVDLAEEASLLALRTFAYEEAVNWLTRAAPVVMVLADRERWCDLLLNRGDIENRAGWAERAKATHLEAADIARELGSGPHMARAAVGYAYTRMNVQTVDEVHLRLCTEADELLGPDDHPDRAALLASWGTANYWGDTVGGTDLVDESIAMARRVGNPTVLGAGLLASAWLAWGDGHRRIAIGQEMLDIARRSRDVEMELWGHRWLHVGTFDVEGPTDQCRSTLATYVDRADQAQQPHHRWFGDLYRSNFALLEGRLRDAEVLIEDAFEIGQTAEPITALQYYGAQTFALRWLQGRMDELLPLAEMTVAQYPEVQTWRALLAYLYAATDQPERAQQSLLELEAFGWDEITSGGTIIMAHGLAAEAAVRAECVDVAQSLIPRLAAHGDRYVHMAFVVTMGSAHYFLGRLLATTGELAGGIAELEKAEAADLARRLPPLLVRDRLVLAELLEKRGAEGDGDRSAELRALAEAAAEEIDMAGLGYL